MYRKSETLKSQKVMRVLDIDLDFFLEDCCPLAEIGCRPELREHEPWDERNVAAFLEKNCGLCENIKIPGEVFETHDKALLFWRDRIADGTLKYPFHVTHVDAHSDLGIGYPGPGYVLNGVLPQQPDKRADPERYYELRQLDEANYLLFALAFRWIASLDNVRNPKSRKDIPEQILLPGRTDRIRLSSFASKFLEGKNGPEPEIQFDVFEDYRHFSAEEPYDFLTLAVSPRYTPQEAEALIPVFQRYMIEAPPLKAMDCFEVGDSCFCDHRSLI